MAKNLAQRFFMVAFLAARISLGTAWAEQTRPLNTPGDPGPHPGGFTNPGTVTIEAPPAAEPPTPPVYRKGEASPPAAEPPARTVPSGPNPEAHQGHSADSPPVREGVPPEYKRDYSQGGYVPRNVPKQDGYVSVKSGRVVEERTTKTETRPELQTVTALACANAVINFTAPTPSGEKVRLVYVPGRDRVINVTRGVRTRTVRVPVGATPAQITDICRQVLREEGVVSKADLDAALSGIYSQLSSLSNGVSAAIDSAEDAEEAAEDAKNSSEEALAGVRELQEQKKNDQLLWLAAAIALSFFTAVVIYLAANPR